MTPEEAKQQAIAMANEDLYESVMARQYQSGCDQYGPPDILLFAERYELDERLRACGFLPQMQPVSPAVDDVEDAQAKIDEWKDQGYQYVLAAAPGMCAPLFNKMPGESFVHPIDSPEATAAVVAWLKKSEEKADADVHSDI